MAQTLSITNNGNGKFTILDSDGQTRVVNQAQANAEAAKSNVAITNAGVSTSTGATATATGFQLNNGANYPTAIEKTVLMPDPKTGKLVPTKASDAISQAYNAKNLGLIRTNLIKYGQLTKAEARDPNNLLNKWSSIVYGAANDPSNNDPFKYAAALQKQGFGTTPTASTTPKPYIQIGVWDPTKAKDAIVAEFVNTLHREPTAGELISLTNQLKSAQEKAATTTTYTTDKKTGAVTGKTTGGMDEGQFIRDLVRANPDYAKVKEAGTTEATQAIQKVANDNGIVLSPEDLKSYAERVRNGEPVDQIASIFRKIAAVSQPKAIGDLLNAGVDLATIYQPYKSAMAQTLEIDPNTIKISDPALTKAISGDKTMTSYEFQRELRKDPRWQYTDNARSEAADIATTVLRDFGFMR